MMMMVSNNRIIHLFWSLLLFASRSFVPVVAAASLALPVPVIFDTDYGSFIDDIFALGLLLSTKEDTTLMDLRYVLTTSEEPALSAKCVAKHIQMATGNHNDIPVGVGSTLPPFEERGSVCGIPGLVGFALKEECQEVTLPVQEDGVADLAQRMIESDRKDWWYIAVGGQSSLQRLVRDFPEAASRIDTVLYMGGNWCTGYEVFPGIMAPTDETNIGCDPKAANFLLTYPFPHVYYVPVEVADTIQGNDYRQFVHSSAKEIEDKPNPDYFRGAQATMDLFRSLHRVAKADSTLLIHPEAMKFDPETESTPMFDPCTVMLALELLQLQRMQQECPKGLDSDLEFPNGRVALYEFDAVRFLEVGEGKEFPDAPRAAYSLFNSVVNGQNVLSSDELVLPPECPALTKYTFDKSVDMNMRPVTVALGFTSPAAKASFYTEMAQRMAGTHSPPEFSCGKNIPEEPNQDSQQSADESTTEQENTAEESSPLVGEVSQNQDKDNRRRMTLVVAAILVGLFSMWKKRRGASVRKPKSS